MEDLSNRVIKGYELRQRVGAGGFGAVYRAYQPTIGREVAVKVILPQHANHPDFIRRFELEAQLIARLEHPHIVPLYDYWRDPEGAFLVMRWLKGSLRDSIERGPWSIEAASRLLEQVASALTIAHREGIIHRDIKPDNILLDEDENAYLADFGIAKDTNMVSVTAEGDIVGSPAYITPEQIKGETVTPRTDIYSIALVIYEILTGEKPFPDAATPIELIHKHLTTPLPALTRPNLPTALSEVIQTATAKDPAYRYANVLRFASAFRAAVPTLQQISNQPLPDPLTPRELDILRLMVDGLSNQEIADRLVLSLATVRWYVKQVYNKLDVHGRRQAIERAHQLDLLSDKPAPVISHSLNTVGATFTAKSQAASHTSTLYNPYKGLHAFQETDAANFFGRTALTEQLLARLAEAHHDERFLALVGPSGSGKSSVVKAGLIPALRQGGLPNSDRWFITEMVPGTHPFEELEAALLRVAVRPLPGVLEQLAEDRRGLVRAAKRVLPADQDVELFLVIDQFEELFTLVTDESVRTHFIDNILSSVTDPRSRVRVVITLRADFYDRPLIYPRLAELMRSLTEVVVPLSRHELERAIAGPAERIGLRLEAGLLDTVINDVGEQPGTLPLLQYALTELFERREELTLTLDAYHVSGGISGALARRADELYEELETQEQIAARQLFLRLITLGEGTEDTRRRILQSELTLGDKVHRSIEDVMIMFGQYRLLTFDRDPVTRGPTVEIAHEALIRAWGLLRGWLDDKRDDLHVLRRLTAATGEWMNSGHDPSFLASGGRLARFEMLTAQNDLALNESERDFLQISIIERDQQIAVEQERQQRELELAQEAASHAAIAQTNFIRAERMRLAVQAGNLLNEVSSGNTAALLALRSLKYGYTAQADDALVRAISLGFIRQRYVGHGSEVLDLHFSQDGRYLLTSSTDSKVLLWEVQTGTQLRQFDTPLGWTNCVTCSSDARYVLTGHADNIARLWNLETGEELQQFVGHDAVVSDAEFINDGQTVMTFSHDETVRLWNIQSGTELLRFATEPGTTPPPPFSSEGTNLLRSALSPDQKRLLTGAYDGIARLWDVQTGEEIRQFSGHVDVVWATAISRDGQYALTGSSDNTIRLWDVQTGEEIRQFNGHTARVNAVAFSPDGRYILTGSGDRTAILWDAQTGEPLRQFKENIGAAWSVAFSYDGQYILISGNTSALLWDVEVNSKHAIFVGHTGGVERVTFSKDGKFLLTSSTFDGTTRLWNFENRQEVRRFTHPSGLRYSILSFDGNYVVTGNNEHDVLLLDRHTGEIVRQFKGHVDMLNYVELTRDNRYAVSTSFDGTVRIWDIQNNKQAHCLIAPDTGYSATPAISPDEKTVFVSYAGKVAILWDMITGKEIRRYISNDGLVASAFASNGKYVAAACWDSTAKIWDVETGELIYSCSGHSNIVWGVTFSHNSRYLLTSSWDKTARLWDVQTGEQVRVFSAHTGMCYGGDFSPDDKYLVTASVDGTARLWLTDYHDVIQLACSQLPQDFTDEERRIYDIMDNEPTCL